MMLLSDKISSTALIAFIYIDTMLLTLCQTKLNNQNLNKQSLTDKGNIIASLIKWNNNKFIM